MDGISLYPLLGVWSQAWTSYRFLVEFIISSKYSAAKSEERGQGMTQYVGCARRPPGGRPTPNANRWMPGVVAWQRLTFPWGQRGSARTQPQQDMHATCSPMTCRNHVKLQCIFHGIQGRAGGHPHWRTIQTLSSRVVRHSFVSRDTLTWLC